MSLSSKASKLNRDVTGSGKMSASKDGSLFITTEQTGELSNVTAYMSSNADIINANLAKVEFSGQIESLTDVMIIAKVGENYLFSGEITIIASDYIDTLEFKYTYNDDNDIIKDSSSFNGSGIIELVDVIRTDGTYIGLSFSKTGSVGLSGFTNSNKYITILKQNEYTSVEDNSYLSSSNMFNSLPQVPKPNYPMRNTGGVVNSLNNRFYLYPGVQSPNGLTPSSMYGDENGFVGGRMSENVFEYNLETNTWKPLRSFPELAHTTLTCELEPGKNIISGIASSDPLVTYGSFGNLYIHDIVNDTYEKITLPKIISLSTFINVNGIIYFIGGIETILNNGTYTNSPFYGLFTYNINTGSYTYDATKFDTLFKSNLSLPDVVNNSKVECYNAATYVASQGAIFFSLACFKNFQKKTIIYKFTIATQTLEEFVKFDESMSVRKLAFDEKTNSLIFIGGGYSYYGNIPNQSGTSSGWFYTGAVLNIHSINVTTKDIYLLDPLPSPGFISSAIGQFKDGRIILACGCTLTTQGKYPTYIDPINKVVASLPQTNNAMIVDVSKTKTLTLLDKVNRFIPLLPRNIIPITETTEWNRANSLPIGSNIVSTIVENNSSKKFLNFNTNTLQWSQSSLPSFVTYRLSIMNGTPLDYDSSDNVTFTSGEMYNYSLLAYSDFSSNINLNKALIFSNSVIPSSSDGTNRFVSNNIKWYATSYLSNINWIMGTSNANKNYFRDTYYEQTNANTFIRDLPVTINYEPNGLIFTFGGKDVSGYGIGGYGVLVKSTNITFRFSNILSDTGTVIPPSLYSFYGSSAIQLSHTDTIVIGGMKYDNNGFLSNSLDIFKITIVPKNGVTFVATDSSTFPTLQYKKLTEIPYDMVDEGWIRSVRIDTDNIVFYSGKSKSQDGVPVLNYNISLNKVTYISKTNCTDMADMVNINGKLLVPYGLNKSITDGKVSVTPPFIFKYGKYKPQFKFTGFGNVPSSILGVTSDSKQVMVCMATVLDSSNKLHYFGGVYGTNGALTNVSNLHLSCQLTINADKSISLGSWNQEAIPSNILTAMAFSQAVLLKNGKILITGGWYNEPNYIAVGSNRKAYLTSSYIIYDPTTNTYTKFAPTIVNSPEPTKTLKILAFPYLIPSKINDNEVFVVSGLRSEAADYYTDPSNTFTVNKVFKLNISNNTLTYLDTFPSPFSTDMTPIRNPYSYNEDGMIYFFGQSSLTGNDVNNDVFVFDTITEKFDLHDANGNFTITNLSYTDISIPADLYADRVSKRMDVYSVTHSNGSTYLIPWTRVNSKLTGYELNPFKNTYFTEDIWKPIEIDISYNNQLCPPDVAGLMSAATYSVPKMFELSDGRMVLITAFMGQGANTSYWINGSYPFTLIE